MTKPLDGKVAIVTGASAGIGEATAIALAEAGARVAVAARRGDECERVAGRIAAQGGEALAMATDVSREKQVRALADRTVERWGRLDIAFNNAGILGSRMIPTADYDPAVWDEVIAVNLTGVFYSMKHQIPAMLASGGGAIVNMSSVAGQIGGAVGIAYYASKHGVIGATKAAAVEYAKQGIRVNAVCPALIETEMAAAAFPPEAAKALLATVPQGRFGTVEEVAQVVVWLCSEEASFITGVAMPVDGGLLAR